MAGEAKLGAKAAEEVIDLLKQAKDGDQLDTLARKTGFEVEALEDIAKKGIGKDGAKDGKDVLKSIVEKLGGTIESVQTEVNTLLGRTRDVSGGQVPPSAAGQVEITGPVDGMKGKGFDFFPGKPSDATYKRTQPVPVNKSQLQPEFVESEVVEGAASRMSKLSESAQQGLVPVSSALNKKMFSEAAVAEMAGKAKPGPAGKGVGEVTPGAKVARGEESRTQAERAADFSLGLNLPELPDTTKLAKGAKRAGLGLGVVGLASGFSKEANAPAVIKEAGVDKIEDVKGLADKAEAQGAVTPEQKAVFVQQAEQVAKVEKSLGDILQEEYKQDKARIELLRLTETIMNGLVTAIGANALLNKGSPYAVDFSKGPKTDWAGEFDRLQKDFNTQMNALNEKYKLEAQEKREVERAATQKSQFQQSQDLKRQAIGLKTQAADTAQAEQKELKSENLQAKLAGTLEKINAPEISPAALVSQAGMLNTQARQLLGEQGYANLKEEAAKIAKEDAGVFEKGWNAFLSLVGKDPGKETKAEHKRRVQAMATLLAKKLEEGVPTAPAAPAAAPADAERKQLDELRALKAAKQKGG